MSGGVGWPWRLLALPSGEKRILVVVVGNGERGSTGKAGEATGAGRGD